MRTPTGSALGVGRVDVIRRPQIAKGYADGKSPAQVMAQEDQGAAVDQLQGAAVLRQSSDVVDANAAARGLGAILVPAGRLIRVEDVWFTFVSGLAANAANFAVLRVELTTTDSPSARVLWRLSSEKETFSEAREYQAKDGFPVSLPPNGRLSLNKTIGGAGAQLPPFAVTVRYREIG